MLYLCKKWADNFAELYNKSADFAVYVDGAIEDITGVDSDGDLFLVNLVLTIEGDSGTLSFELPVDNVETDGIPFADEKQFAGMFELEVSVVDTIDEWAALSGWDADDAVVFDEYLAVMSNDVSENDAFSACLDEGEEGYRLEQIKSYREIIGELLALSDDEFTEQAYDEAIRDAAEVLDIHFDEATKMVDMEITRQSRRNTDEKTLSENDKYLVKTLMDCPVYLSRQAFENFDLADEKFNANLWHAIQSYLPQISDDNVLGFDRAGGLDAIAVAVSLPSNVAGMAHYTYIFPVLIVEDSSYDYLSEDSLETMTLRNERKKLIKC